jgi:nucleoside-diphosphate-sugar epimerase
MNVLVTGASGFVGRALCETLAGRGHGVVPAVRNLQGITGERVIGDIGQQTNWCELLGGLQAVVHLAARVHVMQDRATDPLTSFRAVNTDGTLNLARQSAAAGVKRFVFVSSIKVNGEGQVLPYLETNPPAPQDAYAVSKWEAEQGLLEIATVTGMEVVVLRPPLIYGPGVSANFARLMHLVDKGWPLPFGLVSNRRSLLYLGSLVDAVNLCIEHPAAANQTYLVADGEDVSTPELIRLLADCMGKSARLLSVPPGWLEFAASLLGKRQEMRRLLGSLVIDSEKLRQELGWVPPYSMHEGLQATVNEFIGRS